MIWVPKTIDTTAGWVGWSQEFLDQLVGSRVKGEKEGTAPPRYEFKDMPIQMFHDLCQIMALFFDPHFTYVFCLTTVDHLM